MDSFNYGRKLIAALSDKTRVHLVRILACGDRTLPMLEKELSISQEELKAHLELLSNIQLVNTRNDEASLYFVLSPGADPVIRNFLENNHIPADEEFCRLMNIREITK